MGYILGLLIALVCSLVKDFQKEESLNLFMCAKALLFGLLWPLVIVGYFFQKNLNVNVEKKDGELVTEISFDEKKLMSLKKKKIEEES